MEGFGGFSTEEFAPEGSNLEGFPLEGFGEPADGFSLNEIMNGMGEEEEYEEPEEEDEEDAEELEEPQLDQGPNVDQKSNKVDDYYNMYSVTFQKGKRRKPKGTFVKVRKDGLQLDQGPNQDGDEFETVYVPEEKPRDSYYDVYQDTFVTAKSRREGAQGFRNNNRHSMGINFDNKMGANLNPNVNPAVNLNPNLKPNVNPAANLNPNVRPFVNLNPNVRPFVNLNPNLNPVKNPKPNLNPVVNQIPNLAPNTRYGRLTQPHPFRNNRRNRLSRY